MKTLLSIILIFLLSSLATAQITTRGQASFTGITAYSSDNETSYLLGLRYIPEADYSMKSDKGRSIDINLALNLSVSREDVSPGSTSDDGQAEAYRATLRYATPYSETRIGLQKINFGPAQMLRAEQWFDSLDPRDPLSMSNGVWGIVHRRYFRNNANIWLWGLYGNTDLKGFELYPSAEKQPEWGARLQIPALGGSMAFTMHQRKLKHSGRVEPNFERLFGFDGRWDYGAGFWFEAVTTSATGGFDWAPIIYLGLLSLGEEYDYTLYTHRALLTLGIDYTLGVGNGIYLIGEAMFSRVGKTWSENEAIESSVYALGSAYPLGLSNRLSTWIIHSPDPKSTAWIGSISHTLENWTFQASLFSYPETGIAGDGDGAFLQGNGAQLHLIFNH